MKHDRSEPAIVKEGIESAYLGSVPISIAIAESNSLSSESSLQVGKIQELPLLVGGNGTDLQAKTHTQDEVPIYDVFLSKGLHLNYYSVQSRGNHNLTNYMHIRYPMVAQGMGIIFSYGLKKACQYPQIKFIPIEGFPIHAQYYALYHNKKGQTDTINQLLRHIKSFF